MEWWAVVSIGALVVVGVSLCAFGIGMLAAEDVSEAAAFAAVVVVFVVVIGAIIGGCALIADAGSTDKPEKKCVVTRG